MPTEPNDADKAAAEARKEAVKQQDKPETPYPTQEQNDQAARGEPVEGAGEQGETETAAQRKKREADEAEAQKTAAAGAGAQNRAVPTDPANPAFKNR